MNTPIREALSALGVQRLFCAVHERSLPSRTKEDLGCGTPASHGTEDLLRFLARLGFTGLQLGPPGQISPGNLSPYDSTLFSRSTLHLSLRPLLEGTHGLPLLTHSEARILWEERYQNNPTPPHRCNFPRAFASTKVLRDYIHTHWQQAVSSGDTAGRDLERRTALFQRKNSEWLDGDSQFFTSSELQYQTTVAYIREQMLLHEQHKMLRAAAAQQGLSLQGDLQVGLSLADQWQWRALFLSGYRMGAPPSRTNPEGQPWGYPVLDPEQLGSMAAPGSALKFLKMRAKKIFAEYDSVRIDHPHGFVCPWVYQDPSPDPYQAVRSGARLFSVGPSTEHNRIAAFNITREEQLDFTENAYWNDGWVHTLEERQVERYAIQLDVLSAEAQAAGRSKDALVCEVLSTMPYPLGRVIERAGLGRFRVTSKADMENSYDVYLPSNAKAEDWIMVGTHDTPPIWRALAAMSEDQRSSRARYAARFLAADGRGREVMEVHFRSSVQAQILAEFAMIFASRAQNVMIFISDLLGEEAIYNRPGEIHPENWTLRVPSNFEEVYEERRKHGGALDFPGVLALALASRPLEERRAYQERIEALVAASHAPLPDLSARFEGVYGAKE